MKRIFSLLIATILITSTLSINTFARTEYITVAAEPVVSFNPADYDLVEKPSTVGQELHLQSSGRLTIDARQKVNLESNKQYVIVFDIKENTYNSGYFVALRGKGFTNNGSDILFPKTTTGEHRILFTTASTIRNPYIWSYAYNQTKNPDMYIKTTFKVYDASLFADPLKDDLTVQVAIEVEDPIVEEPAVEEPVAVEPVVKMNAASFSFIEAPATVSDTLRMISEGTSIIDARHDVSLKPNTQYLFVMDIKENNYVDGYSVAVRGKGFTQTGDVLFPKSTVGEHRALFTTAAEITAPFIWSFVYNNVGGQTIVDYTFAVYEASAFADPLKDSITTPQTPVVEEPVVEEPVVEEPVVEEPVVEEPVVEEPVVEEPVVEEPVVEEPILEEPVVVDGIKASEAGMVPNSATSANKNATILHDILNKHGRIIIDDAYFMGSASITLAQKNIEIVGIDNAELIYNVSTTRVVFDSNKIDNFLLKNVTVTSLNDTGKLLFMYNGTGNTNRINSITFENNVFNGNVSAYRLIGSQSTNPSTTRFGLSNFTFTNNKIYNTRTTFIMLKDIPFDTVKVNNNTVRNFDGIFIDATVTNGITFGTELRNQRDYLEIIGNSVMNDDSWFGSTASVYHGFVIAENKNTLFDSNHVEGLKSKGPVAIYDAYLSSDKVIYTNNLWKNNITFYPDKTTNTLIKAKTGYNATRLYQNNVFIVEENFADRVGANKEYLYVGFIDINAKLDSFQIIGNKFDIYDLRFQISSREVEEYVFKDNVMNAKYASGRMFITKLVDKYQSRIEFVNNTITIAQNTYRAATTNEANNYFGLIQTVDARTSSTSPAMDLIFSGNTITAPINYAFQNPFLKNVTMSNNTIKVVKSLYKKFSYGGNQPGLVDYPVSFQ
jgi:hypothetical protein